MRTNEWFDKRSLVEKEICGAIKSALHDHDGEDCFASSAAKRVYSALKAIRRRIKQADGKRFS